MKPIHWILGGMAFGAAAAIIILYEPGLQHDTGYDSVEDAANQAWQWGTKNSLSGTADTIAGRVKQGIGRVTGDDDLTSEGVLDQAAGAVKNTAGRWGRAAGETIHDLNR